MDSPDSTIKELSVGSDVTQIYTASPANVTRRTIGVFRGWPVAEQLPTKGAEADIYVVDVSGELRVLKLYRSKIEPNAGILNRITEITRSNRHCFVEFLETGFDDETGRWYELQEYIEGGSLLNVPAEIKNSRDFVERLIPELTEAIDGLHENRIVHCDIKPANILVRSMEPLDLVLTDFGISSLLAADSSRKMTGLKGTPMYWAPEAFSRTIGPPSDWWSLGMIILELLAGEHPFDGLSDSQIIHRLTLGNVTIPQNIDSSRAILLKGLLTRDDTLRWGKKEIGRWLAGERNIPIYYEIARTGASGSDKAYHFEGIAYYDLETLSRAFAASEAPWATPRDHIRYLRTWFETNLRFDEAARMGQLSSSENPELELFRFINSNVRLPFSLMGREVTAELFADCARKYINHRSATLGELRITEITAGDSLRAYYEVYSSVSGESDMRGLVCLLSGKSADEQVKYSDAITNPSEYLWPQGDSALSRDELIDTLSLMRRIPIKRNFWDELNSQYALPGEIFSMLTGSPESYARAAATLESWEERALMLPHNPEHDDIYRNMSADEYEKTGRIMLLGHTSATLAQSASIGEALEFLSLNEILFDTPNVKKTSDAMQGLPHRKATPRDTAFLLKMTSLLKEKEQILKNRLIKYAFTLVLSGLVFFFIRLILGGSADLFLRGTLILSFAAALGVYFLLIRTFGTEGGINGHEIDVIWNFFVFMIGGSIIMYRTVMADHPFIFSFAIGIVPSLILRFSLEFREIYKNNAAVLETCAEYSKREP